MPTDSDKSVAATLSAALERLLTPVVRLLLRYGLTYRAFDAVARRVFFDVAARDFALSGRKLSDSRVAVLTGLARRDVARLRKRPGEELPDDEETVNRAARVVAAWRREPEYQDAGGRPAALPVESDEASFARLVRRFAGDVPVRAVLDELLRVGAVDRTRDGRVRLRTRAYVPEADEERILALLGSHTAELVTTIDHNLGASPDARRFQRRVVYDNVPLDSLPVLRRRAAEEGQAALERLDAEIAAHDRDANPDVPGSGRARVALGIFWFEEENDEEHER